MATDDWIERLDKALKEVCINGGDGKIERRTLFFRSKPPSEAVFVTEIVERIAAGKIQPEFRVISRVSKAALGDFEKESDIPSRIRDPGAGTMIQVDKSDVQKVYKVLQL